MARVRQHVNPLKSDFLKIPDVARVVPPPGVPLEVELGSAEGIFLFERAAAEPQKLFVGVEIRRELAEEAEREAHQRGLLNVRSVFANISLDLRRLFADASVAVFHINFPDPWFKSRQKKRRVMSPELFAELHPLLQPEGVVSVMTDIFELGLDAMAALESDDQRYGSLGESWRFYRERAFAAKSRREQQCEDEGKRVWRLLYRRR